MRRSDIFLATIFLGSVAAGSLLLHSHVSREGAVKGLALKKELVREQRLTDLALFTEARYTRHPSMADLNTPFQDYPFSLEHFPSGSLVPVPDLLRSPVSGPLSTEAAGSRDGLAR